MTGDSVNFVNAIVAARAAERTADFERARRVRAIQRQQFAAARDIGIQRRHATRTGPLSATQSQDPAVPAHPDTTTNGGIS